MDVLSQYRDSVKERLENADVLVSKLVHENTILEQNLEIRNQELESSRRRIKELEEQLKQSDESMELVKDLFEHLCGVRVHKCYEDDAGLWFDTSQGSRNGIMDYKLGFVRGDEAGTEVVYIPLLKQRSSDELKILQQQIPSYMFDTLSFPLKSLPQFYSKMARCLGKEVKDSD